MRGPQKNSSLLSPGGAGWVLLVFTLAFIPLVSKVRLETGRQGVRKPLFSLLLLRSDFLGCGLCADVLAEFNNVLPQALAARTVGLVVPSETERVLSDERVRIWRKRLRGFRRGNSLRFPLLFDSEGRFRTLVPKGSLLLILNTASDQFTSFPFPMEREGWQRLLDLLGAADAHSLPNPSPPPPP